MTCESNIVRPLGILENFFQVNHDIDYYYNVGFLIHYKVPMIFPFASSQSSISVEIKNIILQILYPTLEQTILHHPELAISFADLETSNPIFIRIREIDLKRIISFKLINDDRDIELMLEEEHDKKFDVKDQTLPLWRMVVGTKCSSDKSVNQDDWNLIISIFFHHSIGDGRSALVVYTTFHELLLKELNKYHSLQVVPTNLKSKFKLPLQSTISFNKPIEQILNLNLELNSFKELIFPTFDNEQLKGYWLGAIPTISLSKNTTKVLLYSITAKELKTLIRQGRQNKTTITSMFNIAVIFSAYHHLILASNQENFVSELAPFDTIKLSICVDLR